MQRTRNSLAKMEGPGGLPASNPKQDVTTGDLMRIAGIWYS